MTKETIHGKVDGSRHDGKRASIRRIAETDEQVSEFWKLVWPELYNYVVYGVVSREPKSIQKESPHSK